MIIPYREAPPCGRGASLLSQDPKQQCQDNTDQDGGGNRNVERELLPLDDEIAREPSDPGNLFTKQQKDPGDDNENPQKNE
jgi:hypothetical protein